MRPWFSGAKLLTRRALRPDAELVAVAVLLHDLGLARGGSADRRFEVVGADLVAPLRVAQHGGAPCRDRLGRHRASHHRIDRQHKGADVACCQHGSRAIRRAWFSGARVMTTEVILSAYPRLDMKNVLTTCLCSIAKNHPNTTRDNFIADFGLKYIPGYTRPSAVDFLHQSPFAE